MVQMGPVCEIGLDAALKIHTTAAVPPAWLLCGVLGKGFDLWVHLTLLPLIHHGFSVPSSPLWGEGFLIP